VEEALKAKEADYISVGPIFETRTKKDAPPPVFPKTLREVKEIVKDKPICAIGGINEENLEEVIRAGADFVCVHSAIFSYNDWEGRAFALLEKIKELKVRV
jgi:thiamine-phosphate pyrophosphorylase